MAAVATENGVVQEFPEPSHDEVIEEKMADSNVTVKIDVPGSKSFELQVSTGELVNDLRGYITDREDCCHRTCFSLQFNGIPMDHFAELRSIENLKDGVLFKVVEEVCFNSTYGNSKVIIQFSHTLFVKLDCTFVMCVI